MGSDGQKTPPSRRWLRSAPAAMFFLEAESLPGAVPVLFVHDEIVVECAAVEGDRVAAWVKQAMVDALMPLIRPVPVEVEVKVAKTWGRETRA